MCCSHTTQREEPREQLEEPLHWIHHCVPFLLDHRRAWILRHDGDRVQQLLYQGDAFRSFGTDQPELLGHVLVLISVGLCRQVGHLYAPLLDVPDAEFIPAHPPAQPTLPKSRSQPKRPGCAEFAYHDYPSFLRYRILWNWHYSGVHWSLLWIRSYLLLTGHVLP